jgi:hypothetical protein
MAAQASDEVNWMAPAPSLPPLSETPAQLPAGFADAAPAPAPARFIPRTAQAPATPFARTAETHRGFLSSIGAAQADYLSVMGLCATRLARTASSRAPRPALIGNAALSRWMRVQGDELFVDLNSAPWLTDHRPGFGAAVLPMTCIAEIAAASAQEAVPGRKVIGIRNLSARRWIIVPETPARIRRRVEITATGTVQVTLLAWRQAAKAELSRDEPVASAEVIVGEDWPAAPALPPPLADHTRSPDPYEALKLFHGPAFQAIRTLHSAKSGASATIDAAAARGPVGAVHPVLLDSVFQTGADGRWTDWCQGSETETGKCLPFNLSTLTFYGPPPEAGMVEAELRGAGIHEHARFPVLDYWASAGGHLWLSARLILVASPRGPMDDYPESVRRAYLSGQRYLPDVHLARFEGDETVLAEETVARADWIPGSIATAYRIAPGTDVPLQAAIKEHAARHLALHPASIDIEGTTARDRAAPARSIEVHITREGGRIRVRSA